MRKFIKTISILLAGLLAVGFVGCKNKDKIPDGYVKESAGRMFLEKEDVISDDGTVRPDMSIRIYNYCPSIFETDENTRYAYYCSNRYTVGKQMGENFMDERGNQQVTDYIAFRKGLKIAGEWYWSPKNYVLSPITLNGKSNHPTEGQQVCDPNVIKGEFSYNGTKYGYLMAYLACSTRDNQFNNICLAVADKPEGPWIRCEKINPLLKYTTDDVPDYMLGTYLWGYGQASMISVDKKGRVLMFYSAIKPFGSGDSWWHGTLTSVARYDFSNLNNITREFFCEQMNCTGILRVDGNGRTETPVQVPTVTNGDYAYDPASNVIYGITDGEYNAKLKYSGAPVYRIENKSKGEKGEVGDLFRDYPFGAWFANGIKWETVAQASTGNSVYYSSVHNACIIRDCYGWLKRADEIEVAVTGSLTETTVGTVFEGERDPLWSYRIFKQTIPLK